MREAGDPTRPVERRGGVVRFWVGLLAGLLAVPFVAQYGVWTWLVHQASQGKWYEDKVAKSALLSVREPSPAVIFIGASTTQNHIDTAELARGGLDAFNYGVPGMSWDEYPSMIRAATARTPRLLVLHLPHHRLREIPSCPRQPALFDVLFYLAHNPACVIGMRVAQWRNLGLWRRVELANPPWRAADELAAAAGVKAQFGYDPLADGRGFNFVRGSDQRKVVTFGNGDGLIFSHPGTPVAPFTLPSTALPAEVSSEALDYLRRLVVLAGRTGSRVVLLLDGLVEHPDPALAIFLREATGADVIDNTARRHALSHWADPVHYNALGMREHTRFLSEQLSSLISSPKETTSKKP